MFDYNNQNSNSYVSMASGFMSRVYLWMSIGLLLTALVSFVFSPYMFPHLMQVFVTHRMLFFGLMLVQMGLVFYLSARWNRMQTGTLGALYVVYSLLNGISLAPIFYVYTKTSIFSVFLIASVMFAVMALYGWLTKSDLSSMGNILFMGLIGLCVASLIQMFWQNPMFSMAMACIGVAVFSMYIAYEVQTLKHMSQQMLVTRQDMNKMAIIASLSLYLNMINLFIYLLQLFGQKRRD